MIDLTKAPAYFSVLHAETGSHDEAIRRIAAHYYQRGLEESHNAKPAVHDTPMGRLYGICADDDSDPPRLGCHTSWPHQADKVGEPCRHADHKLPACHGCGRLA